MIAPFWSWNTKIFRSKSEKIQKSINLEWIIVDYHWDHLSIINFDYSRPQKGIKEDHKSNNNDKNKKSFFRQFGASKVHGRCSYVCRKIQIFWALQHFKWRNRNRKKVLAQCAMCPLNIRVKEKNYFALFIKDAKRREQKIAIKLIFGCFPTSNRVKHR